jgi:1,4-dihydroxy-2-naphthoyl-CoA hydrolase
VVADSQPDGVPGPVPGAVPGPAPDSVPDAAGRLTAFLHQAMPFAALLDIRPEAAGATEVRASLDWTPERCTAGGVLHGGAVMALADSVGAWCGLLNTTQGAHTTTLESKTNFFAAVRGGRVEATARPLHVGGTTVVVDVEIRDEGGRLVARSTQTQLSVLA